MVLLTLGATQPQGVRVWGRETLPCLHLCTVRFCSPASLPALQEEAVLLGTPLPLQLRGLNKHSGPWAPRVDSRLAFTHSPRSGPQVSRSACLMTTQLICKLLRSREAAAAVDVRTWPLILDTGQYQSQRDACMCPHGL